MLVSPHRTQLLVEPQVCKLQEPSAETEPAGDAEPPPVGRPAGGLHRYLSPCTTFDLERFLGMQRIGFLLTDIATFIFIYW